MWVVVWVIVCVVLWVVVRGRSGGGSLVLPILGLFLSRVSPLCEERNEKTQDQKKVCMVVWVVLWVAVWEWIGLGFLVIK